MKEVTFDDKNFQAEVLDYANGPVLVDFFATWCGPCKMMAPIIESLAKDLAEKNIKIGKLDVDQAPETAQKYDIMSIPTLIIFKDGQVVEQMQGVQSGSVLKEKLLALV